MNHLNLKDCVLYFITANVFLLITMQADNEAMIFPVSIILIGLLFVYLIRINQQYKME
jgi:hypothetical protein